MPKACHWYLPVDPGARQVSSEIPLAATGVTELEAWFLPADADRRGAYYVYVQRL